jgi:hypothetical protein
LQRKGTGIEKKRIKGKGEWCGSKGRERGKGSLPSILERLLQMARLKTERIIPPAKINLRDIETHHLYLPCVEPRDTHLGVVVVS